MALKNILVHLDDSHHAPARLKLALGLAQRHQARLTAVTIIAHPFYEPRHLDAEAKLGRMQAEFGDIIARSGGTAELLTVDSQVAGGNVAEALIGQATYSDLVIVGQTDHEASDRETPADLPERVILGSGRPVLVVPYTASYREFGGRVLVAWRAGRESTRAVNDAIPLLELAELVNILVVDPPQPDQNEGEKLCAHLSCHGIVAKAERTSSADISVGDALLNRTSVEGSDLLVMGACAHTGLGAPKLSEVARHVLKHMTLPVLMSH